MAMFSKELTKSDVEKSLQIPTCSFNALPFDEGHCFYMNVVDNTGNVWTFPCFVQRMSDGHQQNAESFVISIGWQNFARKKDVRVGDKVYLHWKSLDDNSTGTTTTTQIRIEVKRKIVRLFGQDIWVALDQISDSATNNYI